MQNSSHVKATPTAGAKCGCCCDANFTNAAKDERCGFDLGKEPMIDISNDSVLLYRNVGVVKQAGALGCPACVMIVEALRFFDLLPAHSRDSDEILLRISRTTGSLELAFKPWWFDVCLQFYTVDVIWNGLRPLPEVSSRRSLPDVLSFTRNCLDRCTTAHAECVLPTDRLPSRLLAVGGRGEDTIQLIDTNSLPSAKYAALSYCWGGAVSKVTMQSTISEFRNEINLDDLPQSFVDAVTLTRELGIPYLWIDAFCILQDSVEDWRRESAKMSDIYAGAELTIAASSAASAKQGFLDYSPADRSGASDVDQRIFNGNIGFETGPLPVKARVIHPLGVHWRWRNHEEEYAEEEPVARRGWTLQERVLSTRLLSFSNAEMQWTCHGGVGCECQSKLNLHRQFGGVPLSKISNSRDAHRYWQKIVENYSRRALTHSRDKLPAISGVAEIIQRATKSDYAAGLWVKNIDLDLLWRRRLTDKPGIRIDHQAPSFSWVSAFGEIDYYCFRNGKQPYEKASSVLSITTDSDESAPLGQVQSGSLKIQGPLQQGVVVDVAQDGWLKVRLGKSSVELTADAALSLVEIGLPDSGTLKTIQRQSSLSSDELQSISAQSHVGQDVIGASIWGLRLGSFPTPRDPTGNSCRHHEIMILGKVPGQTDKFQRLGLASWDVQNNVRQGEVYELETMSNVVIV